MQLNPSQQSAVEYVDGPCLVLAGAGSGKTRVITTKIVSLILRHNLRPERICAVTFTNKAAAEMRERMQASIRLEVAAKVNISTFHALGLKILRKEYRAVGLGRNFSIFDEQDVHKVLSEIIKRDFAKLVSDRKLGGVAYNYAQAIATEKMNIHLPADLKPDSTVAQVYAAYENYLRACNAVDFEDLLFRCVRLFETDAQARKRWQGAYDYILVDEFQDTNQSQYALLCLLADAHKRFTVVGDDDQSIYSWRGADPRVLRYLGEDYPNLKVIKLEHNYRSTKVILRCANSLISNNAHSIPKQLYTELPEGEKIELRHFISDKDEARFVAKEICLWHKDRGRRWSDMAVLYRSNALADDVERELRMQNVPVEVSGGTSFYERQEVKDMMAWCRVLCNPHDDQALLRIINVPGRSIGVQTIKLFTDEAQRTSRSIYACAMDESIAGKLGGRQIEGMAKFLALIAKLRRLLLSYQDVELARRLADEVNYEYYLRQQQMSQEAMQFRMNNVRKFMAEIEELVSGRADGVKLGFDEAVDRLGLKDMLSRQKDGDKDAVQLMTLHAAKGLEFPVVYLLGLEEGVLPHQKSIEEGSEEAIYEERRLCSLALVMPT